MHCKSVKGFAILRKITKCPPLARSDKDMNRLLTLTTLLHGKRYRKS